MFLAIDVGNSQVKWAALQEGEWHSHGKTPTSKPNLAGLIELSHNATKAAISHVGPATIKEKIRQCLDKLPCTWIKATAFHGKLRNNYQPPESLGSDRWCALLALLTKHGQGTAVLAGTAVTVDCLPASGTFEGGLIIPGRKLMHESLRKRTTLTPPEPRAKDMACAPNSTNNAIAQGCLQAILGAISRHVADCGMDGEPLVMAGGDAPNLIEHMPGAILEGNLLFDGIHLAAT